jgi:MSHA biogenesis protein MshQ
LLAANFDLNVIDDDASPDNSNNPAPGVITGLTIDSGSTNGVLGLPGFIGGDAGFTFSAPGTSNTSLIEIDLDLDEITNPLPWLKFDWTGVGDASPPQFDAVFGRYRGNDRIIYWREVF